MNSIISQINDDSDRQPGVAAGMGDVRSQAQAALLSKTHIRPFFSLYVGASLIQTGKGGKCDVKGGGKRKEIQGFSKAARYRLMCTIARIRRDVELPMFVTLTYPKKYPDPDRAKRDLKIFLQRLARAFLSSGWIWKLEPQVRGAAHFHMMVWGVEEKELLMWVVNNWFEIAGDGDINHKLFHLGILHDSKPCVQQVHSWRGVWSYASKYLGKTFEQVGWKWSGRFWGVGNRLNIPFGELKTVAVSWRLAVSCMRYQRRFMKLRRGFARSSLITFCDADQWAARLLPDRPGAS